MSDRNSNAKRGCHVRVISGVVVLALLATGYVYVFDHTRIIHLDEPHKKERLFFESFPTAEDINSKLSNVTIVFSASDDGVHSTLGNEVVYFDNKHALVQWFDGDKKLYHGRWAIRPEYLLLTYKGKWRFATIQVYCFLLAEVDPIAQQENCREMESIDDVIPTSGTTEYAPGDVFHLLEMKRPPFDLPRTKLTVAELQAMMAPSQNNAGARDVKQ